LAYRVPEFCKAIGLGRTSVYALINDGTLDSIKIGKCRLIPRKAALALLDGRS
jgi:excisionase family DNA binding protein